MAQLGHVAKQLQRCLRTLDSFTDGQVCMEDCDWDAMTYVTFKVAPKDGLYAGAAFEFKVQFNDNYPKDAPTVSCTTPIYHPNIDVDGGNENVCVSLLNEWSETCTLEDVVQALLFLIYNPNAEDPLSSLTQNLTHEEFEDKARAIYENNDNPFSTAAYDDMDPDDIDEDVRAEDYFQVALQEFKDTKRDEWERTATERNAEWNKLMEEEAFAEKMKTWEKVTQEEEEQRRKMEEEEEENRRRQEELRRMDEENEARAREAENDTDNAGATSAENHADQNAATAAQDCAQELVAAPPVEHPEEQVFTLIQKIFQSFLAKARRVFLACGGVQTVQSIGAQDTGSRPQDAYVAGERTNAPREPCNQGVESIGAQDTGSRPHDAYIAGETNATQEPPCNLEVTPPEPCQQETDVDKADVTKLGDLASRRRRASFVQEDSAARPPYNRCVSC